MKTYEQLGIPKEKIRQPWEHLKRKPRYLGKPRSVPTLFVVSLFNRFERCVTE